MTDSEERDQEQVKCPFCGSAETELLALFGMQMMTSQYYCRNCHSAFEAIKWSERKPNKAASQ